MGEKKLSSKAREALRFIRTGVMHQSRVPSVRELMASMNYKSPRSAMLLMDELVKEGFLQKKEDGSLRLVKDLKEENTAITVPVPLVGTATCGTPILAQENIDAWIPVSVTIAKPGHKYFLLKAKGDSMNNAGINEGDLMLVKQQLTAHNGQIVVALIDDEATVKEFHRSGEYVTLKPNSMNKKHQPIILTRNFHIQGIVIATIPQT